MINGGSAQIANAGHQKDKADCSRGGAFSLAASMICPKPDAVRLNQLAKAHCVPRAQPLSGRMPHALLQYGLLSLEAMIDLSDERLFALQQEYDELEAALLERLPEF